MGVPCSIGRAFGAGDLSAMAAAVLARSSTADVGCLPLSPGLDLPPADWGAGGRWVSNDRMPKKPI